MSDPQRTCVGCRAVGSQQRMIRFHTDADGNLSVSRNGSGRGAWLCRDTVLSCFDTAVGRNGFTRSMGRAVRLESPAELRNQLERLHNSP